MVYLFQSEIWTYEYSKNTFIQIHVIREMTGELFQKTQVNSYWIPKFRDDGSNMFQSSTVLQIIYTAYHFQDG